MTETRISTEPPESRVEEPAAVDRVRPLRNISALGWVKSHLFNSIPNTILTVVALALLWYSIPPLASWALLDAVWAGDGQACRAGEGACWAFVNARYRLIIFGLYPYEEHWRPLIVMVLLVGMVGLSANPRFWGKPLVAIWGLGLPASGVLMWGGVLGLSYVDTTQWGGLPLTLILSVIGIGVSFPLAVLLALGRRSDLPAIRSFCVGYIELIRGVPLISVLFMASVMFPLFMPEGLTVDKLLRAQVGIILFTAAYVAEAVRGGLQAVPTGQYEAADSIGLGYWQKTTFIILPQAIRMALPGIVGQFISTFKDTSLVVIIGLYDLLNSTKAAVADPEWRPFYAEAYSFAAMIYWFFAFFMSRYSLFLERRLGRGLSRD